MKSERMKDALSLKKEKRDRTHLKPHDIGNKVVGFENMKRCNDIFWYS
jgi:hypothetical protein